LGGAFDGVNSRAYAAKIALTDAINGRPDLDFGLMRYQLAAVASCPDRKNCCTFAAGRCVNGLGTGFYTADGTTKIPTTYSGGCGTIVGGQAIDGGQILALPSGNAGNREALSWVDQQEDFEDRGDGWPVNGELRSA